MSHAASRALRWSVVVAWCLVIFAASATPGSRLPGGYSIQAHFTEFAVLGGIVFWALRLDRRPSSSAVLAFLFASAYGASDEIHQLFVPMRTADVMDWLVDSAGALSAVVLALGVGKWLRRSPRQ